MPLAGFTDDQRGAKERERLECRGLPRRGEHSGQRDHSRKGSVALGLEFQKPVVLCSQGPSDFDELGAAVRDWLAQAYLKSAADNGDWARVTDRRSGAIQVDTHSSRRESVRCHTRPAPVPAPTRSTAPRARASTFVPF